MMNLDNCVIKRATQKEETISWNKIFLIQLIFLLSIIYFSLTILKLLLIIKGISFLFKLFVIRMQTEI